MSIFDQTSSLFSDKFNPKPAGSTPQKPKLDLFGSMNLQIPKPTSSGLLATSTPTQTQPGGLFGAAASTQTSQPQSSGLFGSTANQTATAGGSGLFGATGPQAQSTGGLFGSTPQTQGAQQGSGLFGASQPAQQQQSGGLFGAKPAQQGTGLFGSTQPAQQGSGLFGSTQPAQPQQSGSIFGAAQSQPQAQPAQASVLGPQPSVLISQSQLFPPVDSSPRHRSIPQQIELAYSKWDPASQNTSFSTYLYNTVPENTAPFYGPSPGDNVEKWEAALAAKPTPNSVPLQVRGFEQLAFRMKSQYQNITVLQGRLYEINQGLNKLLSTHNLEFVNRIGALRRNHQRLARQTLSLAIKTQVLRNRGYALDSAEEELRTRLQALERGVRDPELEGRAEEIWARMVGVRERGRLLASEMKRLGGGAEGEGDGEGEGMDPEVVARAKKILEDYAAQIEHLSKELKVIETEWKEYIEGSGGAPKGTGREKSVVNGRI